MGGDFVEIISKWASQYLGIPGLIGLFVLVAVFYVYKNWAKVKTWPGVPFLVDLCSRHRIPVADKERFTILVARLEDDPQRKFERLIIEDLSEFNGIDVMVLDRTIALARFKPEETERRGNETARGYLKKSGADVIIWGKILNFEDKSIPKLYYTHAISGENVHVERYRAPREDEFLRLPKAFWEDLSKILRLLVATGMARYYDMQGQYVADQLKPFINRVDTLLKDKERHSVWDKDALGDTYIILANALTVLGMQGGQNEPLKRAIAAYREALKERTRERVPLQWAAIQNNLGTALQSLGERESGTVRLEDAVAAYREALKVYEEAGHIDYIRRTKDNLNRAGALLDARRK